ncbi:PaaI family thioesterase [Marinobacter salicampi]|uniref:PaaI family thioesterase n=1 Tax=Marinobacter salicampi TaxID=435907 RepID=UPI001409744C|nr:PaaI family thioesterase [Marinobacter salicampi]
MPQNDRNLDESSADSGNFEAESGNMEGFRAALGFTVAEWRKDVCVLTVPLSKQHLNRNGFVHGGVFMSLLDSAGGLCGTWCPVPGHVRRCITVSMNTHFMNPARDGLIRVEAHLISRGRKMFFVEARVTREDQLIATGAGTFRYVLGGENEDGAPPV